MKKILLLCLIGSCLFSCASNNANDLAYEEALNQIDTLRIANDSLGYELVFVEPGLEFWMETEAEPPEKLPYNYLIEKNMKMVDTYNFRCQDKILYADLYKKPIHYDPQIDYGYEVNYLLYNYLVFFQKRYAQNL